MNMTDRICLVLLFINITAPEHWARTVAVGIIGGVWLACSWIERYAIKATNP